MSELPENTTTTTTHGDYPRVVGPETSLSRVLDFFELDGYADPSAAWTAFTRAWNWAASLPAAVPAEAPGAPPVVRHVQDGFALSGQWHLPPGAGPGSWLALPLTGARRDSEYGAGDAPDLFAVTSAMLPRALRGRRAVGNAEGAGPTFRLDGVRVPTGFATYSTGTPLRTDDAAFVWTAVTGLAFGAARRLTDALAGLASSAAVSASARTRGGPPAAAAAGLAAMLRDERLSLEARVHGAPFAGRADGTGSAEVLSAQARRASRLIHHVVAAAYEHALPLPVGGGRDPLVHLVEQSSPILHYMRFAVDLLPPGGQRSPAEG
ncbi:hypothetical protein [Streptomyces sp. NPDC057428]|uniref:hypothetical protein n=1 Tax=Streptomyces sp. NPDC057428 TaxID=3346129 RepID=UPI003680A894